jgi:hypothetical protein
MQKRKKALGPQREKNSIELPGTTGDKAH